MLAEAAALDPADIDLSEALLGLYLQAGDADKARQHARTTDQLRQIAASLEERGQAAQALELLAEVAEEDPTDIETRAKLARAFLAEQDAARAHQYLTREVAGTDADLLWALAEAGLRSEEPAEGLSALRDLLAAYPERHHHVVLLGCSVASVSVDTAYQVIDLATTASVERGEWADAAAALNEFVNREPGHVPALMRLVEICVDGGLEATMFSAQGQLVDAYLAAGQGAEARTIAEDLVAREPWDRANIERFRRALTQLGEKNIDQTIADRLSGEMPFVSTALSSFGEQEDLAPEPAMGVASTPAPPAAAGPAPPADDGQTFEMGAAAIDIGFLADRTEPTYAVDPPAPPDAQPDPPALPERQPDSFVSVAGESDSAEVDLSQALEEMSLEPAGPEPGPSGQAVAQNIDEVFQDLRDEVSRENLVNVAVQHQKLAQMYLEMGLEEEAVKALEVAVRAPRLRFEAASMLARLCLKRGAAEKAIDWFERAAEAPAPSPDDGRALLYDLADTLEAQGETARALAVFLELQADAGEYRDLASRLQRLTNAQTQG
jgi:tetratricopeptide (TPR) repeat protein